MFIDSDGIYPPIRRDLIVEETEVSKFFCFDVKQSKSLWPSLLLFFPQSPTIH